MANEVTVLEPGASGVPVLSDLHGSFVESLIRNNKKIREDRALAIVEQAEVIYKREIEDTELKIKQLRRDRENMLDLSPDNALSLIVASDFDAKAFVGKDIRFGIDIRNLEITLDIAKSRYNWLFGK
jgi:hypothetical protein